LIMDVGDWLRSLGLGQYEAVFREAEIGADVLPDLTDADLAQLGIPLGNRKRLLKAISNLGSTETAAKPAAPMSPQTATDAAERRQLTVMFCDLVGSTAISARLDPEDMREVIRAYQDACSGAIARYDGFVAKFMGDGVLAYFGFPRAHEDDAERAARAGLDILAVVAKLEIRAKEALNVRIGIATGIVVVGDLVGRGSAQEHAVVGDTPNLAARLQALAEPGSLVIAEMTRRLLGGTFELKALGPQTLKGFDAPVPVWALLREAENVSRFEASRSQGLTPFVSREHEVALLLDRWRGASEGEGQVALVSGEAGIGKSRILAALREQLAVEPHITVRSQCSPHHVNDAFYPVTSQIWHAAGFVSGEPPSARLDKLEAMIALSGLETKEIAPYLASLLSIPADGRYAALEISPSELRERTIAVLIDLFAGLTRDAPVLALLEDARWIDPTTLDVFGRLIEKLQSLRTLLIVTFRPEFAAPWTGRAHVTQLSLNRFGRRQALAMIERIAGGKALPAEMLEQIVVKTDGVPLFVEELTKTVLESDLLREENGSYVVAAALTPLAIPATLQDSLMARLDRLAPVREIAQIGAAIGREFSYSLIEAVAPLKGQALQDALRQLTTSELIYARGSPPEASYIFKHALVQDTAYSTLLRSRRQRIHADIARALIERFSDQVESAPAVIAHHYAEAGLTEPAVRHWLKAAELALSRSAAVEAVRHIDAGLALIPRLTDAAERPTLELALQIARGNALLALKGIAAPETVAAMTEAKRLLDSGVGGDMQRFAVLYGLCAASWNAANFPSALGVARQIVELAERQENTIYLLVGHRVIGTILGFMGRHHEAWESLERAERYRDPARDKSLSYRFGNDPGLMVPAYKVLALWTLGFPDRAARLSLQVRAEIADHGHAHTVAASFTNAVLSLAVLSGDLETCERHSVELVAYATEKRIEQWRLFGDAFFASARAVREPTRQNIDSLRAAMVAKNRSGAYALNSFFMSQLARVLLIAGGVQDAEAMLREAFAFVDQSAEACVLPELHRLDAQIALAQPTPDRARAEACLVEAIAVARNQEARFYELRAATDLARLRRDAGSADHPRALLEPILAAIEGGETMPDIRNARAVLTEIV
jgi:class 3 adenylate cyclase/predicted ATPase